MRRKDWPPPPSNPRGKTLVLLYAETDDDAARLKTMESEGIMRPSASHADLWAATGAPCTLEGLYARHLGRGWPPAPPPRRAYTADELLRLLRE